MSLIKSDAATHGNISLMDNPISKLKILSNLESRYGRKFKIELLKQDTKEGDYYYQGSPINDSSLKFYIVDHYDSGLSLSGREHEERRNLQDNYINSLIINDLPNLKNIYDGISVSKSAYSQTTDQFDIESSYNQQSLQIESLKDNSDITRIANIVYQLNRYIKNNKLYKSYDITFEVLSDIKKATSDFNFSYEISTSNKYTANLNSIEAIKSDITEKLNRWKQLKGGNYGQ